MAVGECIKSSLRCNQKLWSWSKHTWHFLFNTPNVSRCFFFCSYSSCELSMIFSDFLAFRIKCEVMVHVSKTTPSFYYLIQHLWMKPRKLLIITFFTLRLSTSSSVCVLFKSAPSKNSKTAFEVLSRHVGQLCLWLSHLFKL